MKTVRLLFWLVLLPTILLVVGYRLTAFVAADRPAEQEAQALRERGERERALAERDAAAHVASRIAAQETLARECLATADRATGNALRDADPLLVIAAWEGCGVGCDTDATATALADEWRFYGLKVLLLRTREGGPAASPAGVTTLVLPQCEALANRYGDDYFLRHRDGTLSSAGEIFVRRIAGADEFAARFDPAALLRAHYAAR
jgi:hypothetical protein